MSSKRNKMGWWANLPAPEAKKDHQYLPDTLGIGEVEERDADGQLRIYFGGVKYARRGVHAVLGKYMYPQDDGSIFYVRMMKTAWAALDDVEKFDDLLLAVAHIVTLKEKFDENIHNRTAR